MHAVLIKLKIYIENKNKNIEANISIYDTIKKIKRFK